MKKKKIWKKLSIVLLLLTVAVIGVTISYLQKRTSLTNTFEPGNVNVEIIEEFKDNIKKNVSIKNNGNIPVYVRCNLSVYYQIKPENPDETGNISVNVPVKGKDYTLNFPDNFNDNWLEIDGIYYYKKPLEAGKSTEVFIQECKELTSKKGEQLVVDISTQSIQATPENAVSDAWKKVEVDSTTHELKVKGGSGDENE